MRDLVEELTGSNTPAIRSPADGLLNENLDETWHSLRVSVWLAII